MSQMIIIAIGQMNLAIGAIGGLAAISLRRPDAGLGACRLLWPPSAGARASAPLAGLANGFVIARTGISAFIITLASLSIFKGADLGITRAQPFYGIPESVKAFGNTTILGPIPWLDRCPPRWWWRAMWYLLYRQRIGRYMLAVGGNANAAELSGVSIARTVLWAHGVSGFLAALAGVMLVARLATRSALDRRRLADPLVRRAGHRRRRARRAAMSAFSARCSAWSSSQSSPRRW